MLLVGGSKMVIVYVPTYLASLKWYEKHISESQEMAANIKGQQKRPLWDKSVLWFAYGKETKESDTGYHYPELNTDKLLK